MAPHPKPVSTRPAYIMSRLPLVAVMSTAPTRKMKTLVSSVHFRPIFSVAKKQASAPTRAPAWKVEVMLLDTSLLFSAVMPKLDLK